MMRAKNKKAYDLKESDAAALYHRPPSFTDLLPWTDYDPQTKCFLLEDGISVGAVFEAVLLPCEGRPIDFLNRARDAIQNALADGIPEVGGSPWIFQAFLQDEPGLSKFADHFSQYCESGTTNGAFREKFTRLYREHLDRISKPGGIFYDSRVLGGNWRGKTRVARLVIYRRHKVTNIDELRVLPETELNEVCSKFTTSLSQAGVLLRRCNGQDFYEWLLPWFNPGASRDPLSVAPYPGDAQLPYGHDFAEMLVLGQPKSRNDVGAWCFDGVFHKCIPVSALRRRAIAGHLTAERHVGDNVFSLFDKLPEQSILAMTIVMRPQDEIMNQISNVKRGCIGDGADASLAKQQAESAEHAAANGERLYPVEISVYVAAETEQKLRGVVNEVTSLLLSNNLQATSNENDPLAIDSYIRSLPMAYDHQLDRITKRARLFYGSDVAGLLPLYGRSRGTGNPGFPFFNRGGEPLGFDPLSRADRSKNAHMLLLGPTGAGKSALCIYLAMLVAVVHNARLVIAEAGNSFGLFGKFMKAEGFNVNHITLSPAADVSLPPFADAMKLLIKKHFITLPEESIEDVDDDDPDNDEERDLLGEMEIAARVMITGGDEHEAKLMTRADRNTIRRAIYKAAENVRQRNGDQVITEDVVMALRELAADVSLTEERRNRAYDMADALGLFCDGFEGRLFNRRGEAWPEADVTIVDFALLARDGYQDKLAVAYIGLMNRINDLVERQQYQDRPTVMLTDEGHIITTNPLLASYAVKIVKMWRKLGAWYWIATQNLEDFPDAAKKMLNMMEWWLLLVMPKEEVEQVSRFKDLDDETRALLLSTRKEPGKYVEGVVLADKIKALFRNVPPPLCLALAQTEKEEKTQRAKLMREHGWDDELLAVYAIAQAMQNRRAA